MPPYPFPIVVYYFGPLLLPLLIPLVIIIAARNRANGALIACSALALLSYALLWLSLLGTQPGIPTLAYIFAPRDGMSSLRYVFYAASYLLSTAAWVLALHDAARARRGRWLAILVVTGFLAVGGVSFALNPCQLVVFFARPAEFCAISTPVLSQLLAAIPLAGPIAALVYAIRTQRPRPRGTTPDSLSVSPLSGPDDDDSDGALELRTEPL